ncbi:MAG TPA: AI-2E family transporter, partial [Gemmataceae bacterium]
MNPSEPGPREPEAPAWFDRRLNQTVMSLLAFVLAVHIFEHFAVILQQLLVAVFIAYLLLPVRHWLGRYRVPTLVAYSLIAAGLFGMTLGLAAFIRVSLQDLQQKLPDYRENLVGLLRDAAARVPGTEPEDVERFVRQGVLGVRDETAWVRAAVGSVFDFTTQSLVVLVYLLFILAEQASIRRRLDEAFEPGHAVHVRRAIQTVNEAIAQYIWVKTFVSVLTGLLSGVALYLFGVDYPVLWGVLTFLLNYIPYLGALVAMVLPLLLSLVQFESVPYTFAILAVLTVIQN